VLSIIVSSLFFIDVTILTAQDGNSSYFNIDMLYTNATLFTQVEQQYYVNKTGEFVL